MRRVTKKKETEKDKENEHGASFKKSKKKQMEADTTSVMGAYSVAESPVESPSVSSVFGIHIDEEVKKVNY